MIPAKDDFEGWVGDTVRRKVALTTNSPDWTGVPNDPAAPQVPLDITGTIITAQARVTKRDPSVLAEFRCRVIDGPGGIVEQYLPASVAATIPEGKYPWDMQITWPVLAGEDEPDVNTYLAGTWTLTWDVTRAAVTTP